MTKKACLHVDGGDGSNVVFSKTSDDTNGNGGGGGGVIQVDASQALLYNLSLKTGRTYGCGFSTPSAPGCLVFIKGMFWYVWSLTGTAEHPESGGAI